MLSPLHPSKLHIIKKFISVVIIQLTSIHLSKNKATKHTKMQISVEIKIKSKNKTL